MKGFMKYFVKPSNEASVWIMNALMMNCEDAYKDKAVILQRKLNEYCEAVSAHNDSIKTCQKKLVLGEIMFHPHSNAINMIIRGGYSPVSWNGDADIFLNSKVNLATDNRLTTIG